MEFKTQNKIPELIEFCDAVNSQIICLNYRGFGYSSYIQVNDSSVKYDALQMVEWLI